MFTDLNHFLEWEGAQGQLILLLDSIHAEGSFLLHHFLHWFLKNNDNVCVAALDQSLFHYFNIGKKLGVQLTQEHEKGHLSFINILSNPYEWSLVSSDSTESPSFSPFPVISHSFENDQAQSLKSLFNIIATKCSQTNTKTCLILDNINILFNIFQPKDVLDFIHYCHILAQSPETPGCLVLMMHGDAEDELIVNQLKHKTDLILSVDGLESGVSRDVHGVLTISHKEVKVQKLHYKIMENNVRFFPPGTTI